MMVCPCRNQVETISKALLKYASKEDTVPIPRPVTMALAAAMPNYFCRAEMFRLVCKSVFDASHVSICSRGHVICFIPIRRPSGDKAD